ncbi:MAG: 50S ribosomal protein L18, large subunit ribosomal protein L18 [Candidatus Peregrinibacteria bacterium GW2011_GWC2_39_14]|nr:MAG: 50S ribosomal protein L18 [Candidatus Peregrinibacteria bacterium GW2011_GWA2_38_36]KKR06848.1 MAG: 50S ribosomal protein L18, large subunit ribosomal protein L18 [Candidatus Peregrinibacteria bacterium GW2011_GWC2_39_14]
MTTTKIAARKIRHLRISKKIRGTEKCPRLVIFRSNKYTYAQLVDDESKKTIVNAGNMKEKSAKKADGAKKVGMELAKKAIEKGITECVFDRAGYKYHGRVKSMAEGAREGGLKF